MSPQKLKQVIIKSINNYNLMKKIGIFASFLLVAFVSVYIYSPTDDSSSWQEDVINGAFTMSLAASDTVEISAVPTPDYKIYSADHAVTYATTCPYGATINLSSASTTANTLDRTGGGGQIAATTGSSLQNNTWGYSINGGTNYYPVPLKGTTPATVYTSSSDEINTFNVKYGVKLNNTTKTGAYTRDLVYTMDINQKCTFYRLVIDENTGLITDPNAPLAPPTIMNVPFGQTFNLSQFTHGQYSGYEFAGWEVVGTSTVYAGNETGINPNPRNQAEVILRAIWNHDPDIFDIDELQDMKPVICDATTTPLASATQFDWDGSHRGDRSYVPRTVLKDRRDNKEYLVSKLADGNCWMSQNLELQITAGQPLSGTDTALNFSEFVPSKSTRSSLERPESVRPSIVIESNWKYGNSYMPPASGAYYQNGTTKSSSPTSVPSITTPKGKVIANPRNWEKAGYYYDWVITTISTGAIDRLNPRPAQNYSICPSGWQLPNSEESGKSYENLLNVYGFTSTNTAAQFAKISADPLNFILPGYVTSNDHPSPVMENEGSIGVYHAVNTDLFLWSATNSTMVAGPDELSVNANSVANEYSIRCVNAKNYIVRFVADGGVITSGSDLEVEYGEKINLTEHTAEKDGAVFQGWRVVGTNRKYTGRETAVDVNPDNYAVVVLTAVWDQDVWEYDYHPYPQDFSAPFPGRYKLEVWGAQGEGAGIGVNESIGSFGAYATGEVTLAVDERLYVYTGGTGNGKDSTSSDQGYNGGGLCWGYLSTWGTSYASGGGATDIRTTMNDSYSDRIIVAAGGAGNTYAQSNGADYGYGGDTTTKGPMRINSSVTVANDGSIINTTQTGVGASCAITNGKCSKGDKSCTADNYSAFGTAAGGGGYEGGRGVKTKKLGTTTPGWQVYYNVVGEGGLSYVGGVQNGQAIAGNGTIPVHREMTGLKSGQTTITGNRGNGHARITYLGN